MIALWPIRTRVTCDEIKMTVTAIRISNGNIIDYFCEWWDDGVRRQDWFPKWQLVECKKVKSLMVGFTNDLPPAGHPILSQGDSSCHFCNGLMPCNCKNDSKINLDIENDSESRSLVDFDTD